MNVGKGSEGRTIVKNGKGVIALYLDPNDTINSGKGMLQNVLGLEGVELKRKGERLGHG